MVNPEDRNMAKLLMTDPLGRHFTFDQTLDLAGYGRFHWMLLFGTGIGCISIMVEDNCMAFVLPMAKCELNLSTAEQGFMYVASTLGFVCSSHLWGFFADTWGRRQVLRTALLLCCITSAASSFALNSKMLMISRFTVGLCLSGIKGTSMSYLSEFHNTRMRPVHLSLLSSFIMSSAIFQPLIAMVFLQNSEYFTLYNSFVKVKSWRLFILVGSLVSGLGSLLIHWLPESPKFLLAMGKPKAAIKVLQNMYAVNTGIKRNTFPIDSILPLTITGTQLISIKSFRSGISLIWAQTKPLLMPPNRLYFMLCCIFTSVTFFVTHGMFLWFPQIMSIYSNAEIKQCTTCSALAKGFQMTLLEHDHLNNSTLLVDTCKAAFNFTTLTVSLMLGIFIVVLNTSIGISMGTIGPKFIQTIWFLCASIAAFCLIFSKQFELNAIYMIVLISCSASVSSMCGVFGDLFPTHLRSMAMNLIMMFGRVGGVVGGNVLASTIYWHCSQILSAYAALLLLAAAIVWKVCRLCERVRNM